MPLETSGNVARDRRGPFPSPKRTLRVGVIGAGVMGALHARVYSEMKGVTLVGVADAAPERACEVASRFHSASFSDYRALLNADLDAVSIAVPTRFHARVAVEALTAGVAVLVEKPIAGSLADADLIIETAERTGTLLAVGHIERFNPAVATLRETVRGHDLISLSMTRVGPIPPRVVDVGIIVDLAVHDIDLAHFLTGAEFDEVLSYTSGPAAGHEDTALLMFRMSNGVLVQVMTNWLTPFKVRRIQAAGRDIHVDADLITHQVRSYRGYQPDGSYVARDVPVRAGEPLRLELEAFLQAAAGLCPPAVTGQDGRRALAVALRALESRERRAHRR